MAVITADGSQDCSDAPGEQEATVTRLLYTEVFVALRILKKGGSLVLKAFTLFECRTLNLIYLLNCCFENVSLFKPMSSREAGSELYVVCLNYKFGVRDSPFQQYLFDLHMKYESNVFKQDVTMFSSAFIPTEFFSELYEHMSFFVNLQKTAIESNIVAYPSDKKWAEHKKRQRIRTHLTHEFLTRYPIEPLALEHCLVKNMETYIEKFPLDITFRGSFLDEQAKKRMTDGDLLTYFRREFAIIRTSFRWQKHFASDPININYAFTGHDLDVQTIIDSDCVITRGNRYDQILNTKFMNIKLFGYFNNLSNSVPLQKINLSAAHERLQSNCLEILCGLEPILNDSLSHEKFVIEKFFETVENESINELVLKNVLVIGQRVVGLLYLSARILAGTPNANILLHSSGNIRITNLNLVRGKLLALKPIFDIFNNETDQIILGVVDIKKMRTNARFFDAINMFNNTSCVRIIDHILFDETC